MDRPSFSVGIEEEYLIVDQETRDLVQQPDPGFLARCSDLTGERSTPEFLQCQVEVGTAPHARVTDAAKDLLTLRQGIAAAAAEFGYKPIAASTHPFARWRAQTHTRKERYDTLEHDLGQTVRRLLICGCHVHVGIEDDDLRVDLMSQAAYFLPHLLALSCSSPYWAGEDTGLASYRLTVFDALPRTGLPDQMGSYAEYRRLVEALVDAGCIEDATKIWWDIRPSDKFPTLEQRVTDVCATAGEAAVIAALFQALLAYLFRLRTLNQRWRVYPAILINENRWRAQRYGVSGEMVDHGKRAQVAVAELMDELIGLLAEDAEELGTSALLERAPKIARDGTSAHRQRETLVRALGDGASREEALIAVVDMLADAYTSDHGIA
ncbi:MAG: carboxylate-amine ligase [Pseudomonadota bacterium]